MLTAITRAVSPSISACELTWRPREAIDLARARGQHRAYEACLAELGVEVISLAAEPEYPDAVFVEDAAIVLDEVAVMTRPGAPSRRGESESLARTLERYRPLRWLREPATLDGGDVMLAGKTLFVGVTARSNAAGAGQLAAAVECFGYHVRPVVVQGCLHLKSACSYIGDAVLVHRPWVDEAAFAGMRMVDVPEECGANVLAIGKTVLVPAAAPRTAELLRGLGWQVKPLDNSELMKAEGALTCCSLIFATAGPRLS
ncbi:MAG: arginine deiminase-related protein [Candidatus Solibacter sp.]|nr:arginine deiminase-related protein [Candidatus Solibacter sp.]